MKKTVNKSYDAIIIGGGLGGLVCGCYLAKAGQRIIIFEKNIKVGGYCTSFYRQNYYFDACVYSLSSFRNGGSLYRIYNDLELSDKLSFIRNEKPDIVVTPNHKINFYTNFQETILQLQHHFPEERSSIAKFIDLIVNNKIISFAKLRSFTFSDLLNQYFRNKELKTILSIMLLGYTGLPPTQLSSIVGILIFREFVFDGGYYPVGGMQNLPDTLAQRINDFGGEVITGIKVKKIIVENTLAKGIELENGQIITGRRIISACDSTETFLELVGINNLSSDFVKIIKSCQPSLSAFLVYIGLNSSLVDLPELKSHVWLLDGYSDDIEKIYSELLEGRYRFLALSSPSLRNLSAMKSNNRDSLFLFINMPFKSEGFWSDSTRLDIRNKLINIAQRMIPNLKNRIELDFTATPVTLSNWTLNHRGAAYGLADTVTQFGDPHFSESTEIANLFLAGHWTNRSSGVTSVINSGYITAQRILNKKRE